MPEQIETSKRIENLQIGDMIYKYKNIRIYHNVKYGNLAQIYWFSLLLLDKDYYSWPNTGKLIPHINVRTLPGFDKNLHDGFQLIRTPQKIVPKLLRNALKKGLLTDDMFLDWTENEDPFEINEL